jgi:protein SCO1/2
MSASLRPTLLACCAVAAMFGAASWSMTGGLEHWTFESLRRAQAERGERWAVATLLIDGEERRLSPWGRDAPADGPEVLIVDFIFTRCPTVCRSLGSTYEQLQTELAAGSPAGAGRVGLLSISFDVEHDDAAALSAYARAHHAQPVHWRVAVPATPAENRALLDALGVVVIPDGLGGYAHNAGLHVIDRYGRLHAVHDFEDGSTALAQARRIADAASGAQH